MKIKMVLALTFLFAVLVVVQLGFYQMGYNRALKEVRHDMYFAFNNSYDTEFYLLPDEPDAVPGNLRGNDTAVGRCFPPESEVLLSRWIPGTEWQVHKKQ